MQTVGTFRRGVSTRVLAAALFLVALLAAVLVITAVLLTRPAPAPVAAPSLVQQIHEHQASEHSDGSGGVSPQQLHDHAMGEITE